MTTADIILHVRKKIPYLLVAGVLTFGISYYFILRNLVTFKSEASFYINENVLLNMGMGDIKVDEMNILSTIATNKVMLLISSDELRDSIVKDFDLYTHFHIHPNEEFAHERVLLRLNSEIFIRREANSMGLLHLTVSDGDRFIAAGIANKIVDRVNLMNKQILRKDLEKRLSQYESSLSSLENKATCSRNQFLSFVDSVSPEKKSTDVIDAMPLRYRMIASNLVGKMDKSSDKYEEMLDQYHVLMSSVKTVSNDEWQCITLVKKAMPDITLWRETVLWYSLGVSVLTILFLLSILIYLYQNEEQMNLLLLALKGNRKTQTKN